MQRRKAVAKNSQGQSKTALTKATILDAAGTFLKTRPFRELTVGGLMANTGLSRPTFYQYFNDLHGLMETLLDGLKGEIVEGAQLWLIGEGDLVANLETGLTTLVDVGHRHGYLLRAISDAAATDARLEQVWESFIASFDQVVADRIAQDQARGHTPEFDPLPVAQALNRMDAALLIHAFGRHDMSDKDAVLSAILRLWLSTLYPFDPAALRPGSDPKEETQ